MAYSIIGILATILLLIGNRDVIFIVPIYTFGTVLFIPGNTIRNACD